MSKSKAKKAATTEATAVNTEATTTTTTAPTWAPRNNPGATATSSYGFYGTIGADQKLLVYGDKPEGSKRRPQSKRVVNVDTIRAILSGDLKSVPNGKHLDVHSLGEETSPFREAYLAATGTPVNA